MSNKQSKLTVLTTLIILVIAVIVFYLILRPKHSHLAAQTKVRINIKSHPTLGDPNAPIKFVAFEDLKCVACKIYNNRTYPKIKAKYIDTKQASYTIIALSFIQGSKPAGNAALCLYQQNKKYFFPFVEYVFHHQPDERQDWATVPRLLQFAKASAPQANLDKLSQCIITGRYNEQLRQNMALATKVMQGQLMTPTIYINGYRLQSLNLKTVDRLVAQVSTD